MSFSSKVKQEILNITERECCLEAGMAAETDIFEGCTSFKFKKDCCKRAYIRRAYFCVGTMVHPEKGYHLEFGHVGRLPECFAAFGLSPKEHLRKGARILYFKEAEQISTVLLVLGASVAMMEFENCRVDKDMNNAINRTANAAAANADKVIAASARHVSDILFIQEKLGLSVLEAGLAQVAKARLDDPYASMEDIGKRLSPPISKSGVNHRLKRIGQIADKHR